MLQISVRLDFCQQLIHFMLSEVNCQLIGFEIAVDWFCCELFMIILKKVNCCLCIGLLIQINDFEIVVDLVIIYVNIHESQLGLLICYMPIMLVRQ